MATVAHDKRIETLAGIAYTRRFNAPGWIDVITIQEMIDLTLDAIRRALSSGAAEYRIGSRGLKRYPLSDLFKMLDWWREQLDDVLGGGTAIKCKRIAPADQ